MARLWEGLVRSGGGTAPGVTLAAALVPCWLFCSFLCSPVPPRVSPSLLGARFSPVTLWEGEGLVASSPYGGSDGGKETHPDAVCTEDISL